MIYGLDLFTGGCGLTIALQDYVVPVAYCERDPHMVTWLLDAQREGKIPCAPVCTDVREIRGSMCAGVDVIIGGFPCQDVSVAGAQRGLDGERTGLFFEVVRIAKETSAPFIFLENVPGISKHIPAVRASLEEIGYDCRDGFISAADVGAPHKRERWFLLAHTNSADGWNERQKEVPSDWQMDQRKAFAEHNGGAGPMANTKRPRLERSTWSEPRSRWVLRCAESWATEPDVGRVANGVPFRVDRIKCLGNAVVPLQAKTAFETLLGKIGMRQA